MDTKRESGQAPTSRELLEMAQGELCSMLLDDGCAVLRSPKGVLANMTIGGELHHYEVEISVHHTVRGESQR